MSTTLTDRYVSALTGLLPAKHRRDIGLELRASIADAIDEHRSTGAGEQDAERAVLESLGDPVLLAASYTDRPTALIGPRYYGDYRRVMAVLTTVGPGIAIVVTVAQVLYAVPLWQAVLAGLGAGALATAISAGALTLVFAIVERSSRSTGTWRPDSLRPSEDGAASTIGGLAFVIAVGALLVLSPWFTSVVDAEGQPIPVLSPTIWPTYAPVIVAVLVLAVVFAVVTVRWGWSIPLALVNAVVVLGGYALLLWFALVHHVFNAQFFDAIGWGGETARTLTTVLLVLAGINALVDTVGGFVKARRRAVAS